MNENIEIVGINNYFEYLEIKDVPDEIRKSPTNKYFAVFDKNEVPKRENTILEALKIFNKTKVFDYTPLSKRNLSDQDSESDTVILFKEIGIALLSLNSEELKKVQEQKNLFKIIPEVTVSKISSSHSEIVPPKKNWGLHAIKVFESKYTGKNVKIAVLDTGFDEDHLDFIGRNITSHSFISDSVRDNDGHGTHCIGIACGYKDSDGLRYGVAYESDIYACKVLDDNGKGYQRDVIQGVYWALEKGCKVISLSLESPSNGMFYDIVYERLFRYALDNKCIVVAAVGNDSNRSEIDIPRAIGSPSECPSTLAVSAIDYQYIIYNLCNQAKLYLNQKISFTAPGVSIYSSWSKTGNPSKSNHVLSGTSMAAPFVSGIIAQLWEKYPFAISSQILDYLYQNPTYNDSNWEQKDVGEGLIQSLIN